MTVSDPLYIGIAALGCIPLLSYHTKKWYILWSVFTVLLAVFVWRQVLSAGPIAQLFPAVLVMFFMPGFFLLELAFPALARKLGPLERGPLLLGLTMGVWTLIAAVAFRAQLSSDLVIGGVLIGDILGLSAVFLTRYRHETLSSLHTQKDESDSAKVSYIVSLISVLLIVAGVVAFSAEFQRYDFDTSLHLAGYHKIADSAKIIGGNPYLGPEYDYLTHYISNPWYLTVGLSARLAQTSVTWLYVLLATLLTPLVFLSFYFLLNALTKDFWVSIIGTLLMIGPYIASMALRLGPSTGTFHLQFLPFPYHYTELILFPVWIAFCFRYIRFQTFENWFMVVLLAVSVMGQHPEFLLVVPYNAGIIFIVSLFFLSTRRDKVKTLVLVAVIITVAAALAYITLNQVGAVPWEGAGYDYDPSGYMRILLRDALIISPNLYAMHPKSLLTLDGFVLFLSCIALIWYVACQPKLSIERKTGKRLPSLAIASSREDSQWHLAVALAAIFVGPYLLVYNPVIVPQLVKLLNTPVPIWRTANVYSMLKLVCIYGAISSIFVLVLWDNLLREYGKKGKKALLAIVLIGGVIVPLGRPDVSSMIWGMIHRDEFSVSILALEDDPLYKALSVCEPGVVAIDKKRAEYLLMTTPHHVISSGRMIKKRQFDNERIVNFSVSLEKMEALLRQYDCRYIVVPLDACVISNGDFSTCTSSWDATVSSVIASIPGGQSGNCLQLKKREYFGAIYKLFKLFPFGNYLERVERKYNSQITYQNITCNIGKMYELKGYVRSGTSGDEPFGIQIFRHNTAGRGECSITGATTDSWVEYSARFRADYPELSVVLRKNSATPGTMLFDTISCREVVLRRSGRIGKQGAMGGEEGDDAEFVPYGPLQRFREYPEIFEEILTLDKDAVFEVRDRGAM